MEATIGKSNLRNFVKGLVCLGKNQTLTNYRGIISFTHTSKSVRCKVNIKNVIACLRTLNAVERLHIQLDGQKNLLIIELESSSKIRRAFAFNFEEQHQILQADFSRQACPNMFQSDAHLLSSCMTNFSTAVDEIALIPTEDFLKVKSYVDINSPSDDRKVLQTEYSIDCGEFQAFHLGSKAHEITFCLKEFKAILAFCEGVGSSLYLFFQHGGRPILISNSMDGKAPFSLDLIIATLQLDAATIESITSTSNATANAANTGAAAAHVTAASSSSSSSSASAVPPATASSRPVSSAGSSQPRTQTQTQTQAQRVRPAASAWRSDELPETQAYPSQLAGAMPYWDPNSQQHSYSQARQPASSSAKTFQNHNSSTQGRAGGEVDAHSQMSSSVDFDVPTPHRSQVSVDLMNVGAHTRLSRMPESNQYDSQPYQSDGDVDGDDDDDEYGAVQYAQHSNNQIVEETPP